MRHPYFDLPIPIPIAHRGASGEAPENTLPAFARALEQGAEILETDVHASRDGVAMVCHDSDVSRTTDGTGRIEDLSHRELARLDAGYRFSPEGTSFPFRGRDVRIPTLREIFRAFPGTRFNVEVKRDDPTLIEATCSAIRAAGRERLTLLAAEDDGAMARVRRRLTETRLGVAVGASTADVVGFLEAMRAGTAPPPAPMALQVPPSFAGHEIVTAELVAFAHAHAVQVHVWTINEAAEMHRLLDLGVDGVMTDFPGLLARVLAERDGRP